jgi:fructose-1,6-bisphosphatase/inositol monophosphatase family enzyme
MDVQKAISDIKNFLLDAGNLAVKKQKSAKVSYKDGNQALTETDIAISKMSRDTFAAWFKDPAHVLIDEESTDQIGTPAETFAHSTYQWALDPIDGTAGYALGRRLWGISLGILEKGVPLAGGIYLPALNEMLLADERQTRLALERRHAANGRSFAYHLHRYGSSFANFRRRLWQL